MTTLTLVEKARLSRVRRQVQRGERDEMAWTPQELNRLAFMRWLQEHDPCDCGMSDGDTCYCETTDPARIEH